MTTMPELLITVTLTSLLMSVASAQTSTNTEPDAQLRALLATPGDPARGKKAFATCEGCHRKNASGRSDGTIPRLTGQHASVVVKQVLDIRAGRRSNPSMQPFVVDPAFTMTHLVDIAAYLQALPFEGSIGKGPGTDLARGKENARGDREVVGRAFLAQVGRGKRNRDLAPVRPAQATVADGVADPFA